MATKKDTNPVADKENELNLGVDLKGLDFEAPEGSISVGSAYLYRPGPVAQAGYTEENGKKVAHCGFLPVQGYVVDVAERPSKDYEKFDLISILLTKPCLAIDGEKHVRAQKGEVVVLIVTRAQSMQLLTHVAEHETMTNEVYIKPAAKVGLGGGKTMRPWTVKYVGRPQRRSDLVLPQSFKALSDGNAAPMLPEGKEDDSFAYGANAKGTVTVQAE